MPRAATGRPRREAYYWERSELQGLGVRARLLDEGLDVGRDLLPGGRVGGRRQLAQCPAEGVVQSVRLADDDDVGEGDDVSQVGRILRHVAVVHEHLDGEARCGRVDVLALQ